MATTEEIDIIQSTANKFTFTHYGSKKKTKKPSKVAY